MKPGIRPQIQEDPMQSPCMVSSLRTGREGMGRVELGEGWSRDGAGLILLHVGLHGPTWQSSSLSLQHSCKWPHALSQAQGTSTPFSRDASYGCIEYWGSRFAAAAASVEAQRHRIGL